MSHRVWYVNIKNEDLIGVVDENLPIPPKGTLIQDGFRKFVVHGNEQVLHFSNIDQRVISLVETKVWVEDVSDTLSRMDLFKES
jgi:hypothetical protein